MLLCSRPVWPARTARQEIMSRTLAEQQWQHWRGLRLPSSQHQITTSTATVACQRSLNASTECLTPSPTPGAAGSFTCCVPLPACLFPDASNASQPAPHAHPSHSASLPAAMPRLAPPSCSPACPSFTCPLPSSKTCRCSLPAGCYSHQTAAPAPLPTAHVPQSRCLLHACSLPAHSTRVPPPDAGRCAALPLRN